MNMMFFLIEIVLSCRNDNDHTGVNISIYPVTRVTRLFFGSRAKIFILVFFVQKYSFAFFSCKNISVSIIHDSNLFTPTRQGNLYKDICALCSLAKIFTRNGRKGVLKLSCRNILNKWQENVVLPKCPFSGTKKMALLMPEQIF